MRLFCLLFFWVQLLVVVQCNRDCTLEEFKRSHFFDENLELSTLRENYVSGSNVRVRCQVGYSGFFKLICSDGHWHKVGDRCTLKSCGHPGDVLFADFKLVKGTDYVFGSQVLYTCHKGYQMTSFSSSRNCLSGGWDGRLPECEPIPCSSITVDNKVQVIGDLDQPMPGSVLQFSCRSGDEELEGPSQIICDDSGRWDNDPPTCKKISCSNPPLENFQVNGEQIEYKKDDILSYTCNPGFKKVYGNPSVCKKVGQSGQWTPPPQCEVITCKLSQTPPMGTRYNPVNQNIFFPGQSVSVSCGIKQWVKSRDLQSAELTCQPTGQWDFDPVCQWVKCSKIADNVYRWEYNWYKPHSVDIGDQVWYDCHSDYDKAEYRATCTRGGWEPKPLCKERRCSNPQYKNAEITHNFKDEYANNERVHWRCTNEHRVIFYVDCYHGDWRGSVPVCKEKPCSTQPNIENGQMLQQTKTEYEHGEGLLFRCEGDTDTFTVTCKSGEWKKEKSCQEKSVCGNKTIPNGFSHEDQGQNKLYYSCDEGFKLLTKGWWGVASCEEEKWKTSECVDITDCGPVPDIPNMIASSKRPKFSDGDTFPIHCDADHQNLHPKLEELTCSNGSWTAKDVPLEQICTPIAKKCPAPPQIQNAVIMAFYEQEYPSDTRLTYKCRDNFMVEGEDTIQCKNGTWEQKDISCIKVTCELPASNPKMNILEVEGDRVTAGTRITVQCATGGSSVHLECLSTGHWSSTFPSCTDTCDVEHVPDSLLFTPRNAKQLQSGQKLTFRCTDGSHNLHGAESVTCLENGQWSHPFPSCAEVTCELPAPSTKVNILGVDGDRVTAGTRITVRCVTGGRFEQLDCLSTGKWSSTFPTCFDTCDVEHVPDSVVFSPRNVRQLQKGQRLEFRCKDDSLIRQGTKWVTCLEDGQWSHPFPSCEEVMCELPAPNPKMKILGVEGDRVRARESITVQCVAGGKPVPLRCRSTGEWSSSFPSCSDTCDVEHVPDNVLLDPLNVRQLQRGQRLEFRCKDGSQILRGAESVTCSEGGQWSHPFPSCADPRSCGSPPPLENGDFFGSNAEIVHNAQVEYSCQSKYVMEGGPYKTCKDGEWSGEITCLKPCTVDPNLMTPNNIRFIRANTYKLYAPHDDFLTFECVEKTTHDGAVNLRQKCVNGVIDLPRCV